MTLVVSEIASQFGEVSQESKASCQCQAAALVQNRTLCGRQYSSVQFSSVQFSSVQDGIYALGKAQLPPPHLSGVSPVLPCFVCVHDDILDEQSRMTMYTFICGAVTPCYHGTTLDQMDMHVLYMVFLHVDVDVVFPVPATTF